MNPAINKDYVLRRIATKIVRAAERVGRLPAVGMQAVLRCAGVAMRVDGCIVIETGECAIVAPLPVAKERVN